MLADPNHARRPALPRIRRRLAAALLCAPLLLWPALATANPATAAGTAGGPVATAANNDTVALHVTPGNSSILHLNEDLKLNVTITNESATSIPAGNVDVFLAERALTSTTALDEWLKPDEDDDTVGDLMTSVPLTVPVQPNSTVTVAVTVPSAALGLFEWSPWGPRGIAASLSSDDAVRASGRSTFVWYPDASVLQPPAVTPVNLAVAMPIITPANSTGLISAEDLAAYTAGSGILTRQLEGLINRSVAIAIDPMIIASIRVLGTSAPESAVDWLNRLDLAENDIFPLGYADADPSLAVQAGATGPLAPTSLSFATDPSLFVPAEPTAAPEPGDDTVDPGAPTSSEAPPVPEQPSGESAVPTLDQLLAWDYTSTTIAWPADNAVAQDDLSAFADAGLTTTLLASGNVAQDDPDVSANTTVDLGSSALGLVADTGISQAMRSAVMATTDDDWRRHTAELSSQIAVVAAANPDKAHTLLATLDRGWPPTAARLAQTVDALTALPWYAATTLTAATAAPVSTDVTFRTQAEPSSRVDLATRLVDREAEIVTFSTALADPAAVTAPNRLSLLGLLATSWQANPDDWRTAVGDNLATSSEVLRSVTVSTKGPINVVGSKVDIPITLNNALGQAVTVKVQVVPSNGRLVVGNDVEAVIDASSAKTVSIPVTAAVGNGAVSLRVTLYTPSGADLGQPSLISVNVRADWEGIGSRIFAALVVLFFGFGVWRNIVHRRHDRAQSAKDDPAANPPASADDVPPAPRG
ncbi:hypothetical protein E3O42_07985 [Cryobacterium adonitolivorans]|uniref:2-oxoglutarate dehydrogenase n=1 Tax=Cryobacterium adonitolivorans TaxID=1259189 RepID=A0A4R8W5N5_9MICO|nr:DUF6049 family protein [Cryobacterium adonitolivorans]TFC02684.1 hypothetical protein E3O42_07985 [Cryobacterium adonitolivorans]